MPDGCSKPRPTRSALAAAVEPAWSWAGRPDVVPLLASLIDQGRVQEAAQELMAAHPGEQILDAPPMTPSLLQRMRLRTAQGEHRRALDDWEEAVRRAVIGISPAWIEELLVAADAHHALGDEETARALVARAMTLARRWDTPGAIGQALHGAARLGGGDDAAQMLGDAVQQLRRSPARLELARALVTLGGSCAAVVAGSTAASRLDLGQLDVAQLCDRTQHEPQRTPRTGPLADAANAARQPRIAAPSHQGTLAARPGRGRPRSLPEP